MNLIKQSKILRFDRNFFWLFFSTGALIGFLPCCPGTFGAFEGLVLFWFARKFSILHQFFLILFVTILGIISSEFTSRVLGDEDPEIVVIDEIAGMWIGVLGKTTLLEFLLAFVLFRVIDINKPFPIKKLEKLHGGFGIMVDDLFAGAITNILVIFITYSVKKIGLM